MSPDSLDYLHNRVIKIIFWVFFFKNLPHWLLLFILKKFS